MKCFQWGHRGQNVFCLMPFITACQAWAKQKELEFDAVLSNVILFGCKARLGEYSAVYSVLAQGMSVKGDGM
jgi:hypothetical protein